TMPGTATPPNGAVGCAAGCCTGICCGTPPATPGIVLGGICGFTTCGCGKVLNTGPRGFGIGPFGIGTFGAGRSSSTSSSTGGVNCGCANVGVGVGGGPPSAGRGAALVGITTMRSNCDRLATAAARGAAMNPLTV